MRLFKQKVPMKHALLIALLLAGATHSSAVDLNWGTGKNNLDRLVLDEQSTTAETFTNYYELRLMNIGVATAPYSNDRGYETFLVADIGKHNPTVPGTIQSTANISGGAELNGRQLLPVLYEKAGGKHFFLSTTLDGESIDPYLLDGVEDDPLEPPFVQEYYPISSSRFFYKGAEIPSFCGWLSKYNLTESDLSGISTNLVNLAFAVNANPTNFSGIALAITNTTLSAASLSGAFLFNAKDAAGTSTAVTNLSSSTSFALSITDSLTTPFSTNSTPSLFPTNGIFSVNATQDIQFLRLELTPAELW